MNFFKLSILDRYLLRRYLGTFLFSILALIGIIVVFDMSEKLEGMLARRAPIHAIIFDYILNFIPYFVNRFSSLFAFISVVFFTSNMASHSEFVAMFAGGISLKRILKPYLIASSLLMVLTFYLSNFVIPPSNKIRYAFEEVYVRKPLINKHTNIHIQSEPGLFMYCENYSVDGMTANRFSLEKIVDNKLVSKLESDYAVFDTVKNCWKVYNYTIRTLHPDGETLVKGGQLDTVLKVRAADMMIRPQYLQTMNWQEINNLINSLNFRGLSSTDAQIEKYTRTAMPFSMIILTIIGLSLSCRKLRGGTGLHLGLGIGLAALYILLQQFGKVFVMGGLLPPLLAVWAPNIIFAGIAGYFYYKAPK